MIAHEDEKKEKSFLLSLGLTSLTFLLELFGGILTGSLALISDSAHVFLDVFALGISYLALRTARQPADETHTYGFHRFEVLAALLNGLSLLLISIGIFYESWKRWKNPGEIEPTGMLWVAVIGLVVNLLVARVLHGHQHTHKHADHRQEGERQENDLNIRSAYLHVIGDAISSVGVIIAAILLEFTDWYWLDPLMSAIIGVIIISGSYRVLRDSLHILVEGVPDGIKISEVKNTIESVPGIRGIHDLHVWNICSGNIALSVHVLMDSTSNQNIDEVIRNINHLLQERYEIRHTTIQPEVIPCVQPCCD